MKCINCGHELSDTANGAVVCPQCGTINVKSEVPTIPSTQQPSPLDAVNQPIQPYISANSTASVIKKPNKLKNIKPPLAVLLGLVIIVIFGGGVFAVHSLVSKPKASVPTASKLTKTASKPATVVDTHSSVTVKTTKPTSSTKSVITKPKVTSGPSACYQISGTATRLSSDRPDDNPSTYQVHIIYITPSDGPDNHYDTNGRIADSVSSWENWFCQQSSGKYLRLDTYKGALDITFIKLSANNNTIKTGSDLPWSTNPNNNPYRRDDLQIHLKSLGFNDAHKLYAVYYDGTSNHSCGGGAFPPTLPGHVSAEYMHGGEPGAPDCSVNVLASSPTQKPGYFEYDILHETVHTLGFVPSCAPHNTQTAHVSDSTRDLMYAGSQPWDIADGLILDYNHNDYYNAHIAGCLDLINSAFLAGGGSQLPPSW